MTKSSSRTKWLLHYPSSRLWVCGTRAVSAFQALARQVDSLFLALPRLFPSRLGRRDMGVRCSRCGRKEKMLQVVGVWGNVRNACSVGMFQGAVVRVGQFHRSTLCTAP